MMTEKCSKNGKRVKSSCIWKLAILIYFCPNWETKFGKSKTVQISLVYWCFVVAPKWFTFSGFSNQIRVVSGSAWSNKECLNKLLVVFYFLFFAKSGERGFLGRGEGQCLGTDSPIKLKLFFTYDKSQFATPLALTSTSAAKAATCGR